MVAATLAGTLVLAAATVVMLGQRDWAPVVRIDGAEINRSAVAGRQQVVEFIIHEQLAYIEDLRRFEQIPEQEAALLVAALEQELVDTRGLAIESLIGGYLVKSHFGGERLLVGDVDVGEELVGAREEVAHRRLEWVRLAWQPGQGDGMDFGVPTLGSEPSDNRLVNAGGYLRRMLDEGADRQALIESLIGAGWIVSHGHRWFPAHGGVDWMDAEVIAAARTSPVPGPLSVVVGTGWVVVADVTAESPPTLPGAALMDRARSMHVSASALDDWARQQAMTRALQRSVAASWPTAPVESVRAAEVVLGPADEQAGGSRWVQLAHLVVADVPESHLPAGAGSAADRLIAALRAMPAAERRAHFWQLVDRAREVDARSGQMGFFLREQLSQALGDLAFAAGVSAADVLGPVSTDFGPEIFLVEAQFEGTLDERSIGALVDLRSGATGLLEMASSLSPAESARALGGPWRVAPEMARDSAAYRALFETPVAKLTDPFVLDGELVVAEIFERKISTPDANALARLAVHGLEIWLADRRAAATIDYLETTTDQASPSPPGNSDLPTPLPVSTPRLPVTPGAP